jgi:DNA polymerase
MSSPARQRQYLQLLGIDVWLDRNQPQAAREGEQKAPSTRTAKQLRTATRDDWSALQKQVVECRQCELHSGRKQTVFGVGDQQADWLIIGEAPGAEEDKLGEPFVGRAGKLLNSMLEAIGLSRSQVYIANILKCRPPNNRDPKPDEVAHCETYLKKQIEFIQPRIILAVGRIAAQNLLKVDTPIGKMRGQLYQYPGTAIPLVVTYHPAYLLRSPAEKRKTWQDLQMAMHIYANS